MCYLTAGIEAQTSLATVSGIITDSTGAVVPDVEVVAINSATAQQTSATTNSQGFFVLTQRAIGEYTVEAEKTGFKKFSQRGLTLTTGATVALDIQHEIGQTSESVTVTGETPLLQTRTSDVSTLIESKTVQESGPPFTITTQTNTATAFSAGALRADILRDPRIVKKSSGHRKASGRGVIRTC
jgi:hypothetical protein